MRNELCPARPSADLTTLFDWKSDIERLERALDDVRRDGTPDPWTLCEAECSLDLLANELSILRSQDPRRPGLAEAIRRHETWHTRLEHVITVLQELEHADGSETLHPPALPPP